MKRILLKIPVEPEVKSYLDTFFDHRPCELKKNNSISRFLFRLLRDPITDSAYDERMGKNYTERFEVSVSHHDFFHYKCNELSASQHVEFNNFVRDLFKDQVMFAMLMREMPLDNRKEALLFIIYHYGVEEEENKVYERLKKSFDRQRPEMVKNAEKTLKIFKKPYSSLSPSVVKRNV